MSRSLCVGEQLTSGAEGARRCNTYDNADGTDARVPVRWRRTACVSDVCVQASTALPSSHSPRSRLLASGQRHLHPNCRLHPSALVARTKAVSLSTSSLQSFCNPHVATTSRPALADSSSPACPHQSCSCTRALSPSGSGRLAPSAGVHQCLTDWIRNKPAPRMAVRSWLNRTSVLCCSDAA